MDFKRHAENEREALLRAAELLEADGWCQRESLAVGGERCVTGALSTVIGLVDGNGEVLARRSQLWRSVIQLIRNAPELDGTFGDISAVIEWNDTLGRTQDEVVSLLRRVASTV